MHEAKFTAEIVSAVIETLKSHPGQIPLRVKVAVGAMMHLDAQSVALHFALQVKGTSLEGVELNLHEVPVRIFCRACRLEGGVEDHHLLLCSSCGSRDVELKSGREVAIEQIEMG